MDRVANQSLKSIDKKELQARFEYNGGDSRGGVASMAHKGLGNNAIAKDNNLKASDSKSFQSSHNIVQVNK